MAEFLSYNFASFTQLLDIFEYELLSIIFLILLQTHIETNKFTFWVSLHWQTANI
jgi:hypothetical protein